MANTSIPLSNLIGHLVYKSYHELTVLSELLPKKSDVERKIELVEYARTTRLLFIRLLALVKWAGSATNLTKCDELSEALDQRSQLYIDTADQLLMLSRNTLVNASLPNFSLAGAIDVLTLGKYPRLPTCIHDSIVPLLPLPREESLKVCEQLEHVIQQRLAVSQLPEQFLKNSRIANGQVVFNVPREFEVSLTLLGDDPNLPWRLLKLDILVGKQLPGGIGDTLVHSKQKEYLHQLLQSRLFTDQSPIMDLCDTLHTFCIALKLDLLHMQVQSISAQVAGDHVRVEEYSPGKLLRILYWRPDPSQHYLPNFMMEQSSVIGKVTITIGGNSCDQSFQLDHTPSLPECGAQEACEMLDIWLLISRCVTMRSKMLLQNLLGIFKKTSFEPYVTMCSEPLSLQVQLLPGNSQVFLSVDRRVGRLIASVLPVTTNQVVLDKLEEMERDLLVNHSNLIKHLLSLQLMVAMAHVINTVIDCGLSYTTHLPILKPPPISLAHMIYVQLPNIPNNYLVVGVNHRDGYYGVEYTHYLLETLHVPSVPLPHLGGVGEPSVFLATRSLVLLDDQAVLSDSNRSIPVSTSRMLLKRKFDQSALKLPSARSLCLVARADMSVDVCARLCACKASTTHLIRQLSRVGIVHHMMHSEAHMSSVVHVLQLPHPPGCDIDSYTLLSNKLQSCEIRWCDGKWLVKLQLLQDVVSVLQPGMIVCRYQYQFSDDVGEKLLQDWTSLLKLLGPVLELASYEREGSAAVEGWNVTEFDYHKLKISHRSSEKLTIVAEKGRLSLLLADDNPFNLVHASLELMLNRSLCLPLLLQGMQSTLQPMILLQGLHNEIKQHPQQFIHIQSKSPSQVILIFHNIYSIEFYLNADSTVTIADGGSSTDPSGVHGRTTPLWYLQSFLQRLLQDQQGGGAPGDDTTVMSVSSVSAPLSATPSLPSARSTATPVLAPSPHPIASPRPSPIVSLSSPSPPPLPSLPPLPSPHATVERRTNSKGSWSRVLSWEQFQSLLNYETDGQCPLSRFLGNFYLLNQFNVQVKQDKMQSGLSREGQIQLRSVDRGVYVFHTDTLDMHIAMDNSTFQKLTFTVQPAQEHVWNDGELETLCNYFHSQVSQPPYSGHAVTAFVRLLSVPLRVLKSCVHLMQLQMSPPAESYWHVRLCLTVPHTIDAPDIAVPGNPAVAFRGKLLTFLEFRGVRSYPGLELVIPILHDPMAKSNSTHLAKLQHAPNTSQLKISIMQAMDTVLRSTAQEYHATPPLQQESSLYPCIQAIVNNPLTINE